MSSETRDVKKCVTFTWNIHNFSFCWQKQLQQLASPMFEVDAIKGAKWRLWLRPRGDKTTNYISYFLHLEKDSKCPLSIKIDFELDFLAVDGSVITSSSGKNRSFEKGESWGLSEFENRETVFREKRDKYLPGDTLTARCRIWCCDDDITYSKQLFARTIIKVERRCFEWNINEFSTLGPDKKNSLEIKSASDDVLFILNFVSTGGQYFLERYAINVTYFNADIKVFMYEIKILDVEGKKENCGQRECIYNDIQKGETLMLLPTKKDIMENKSQYLSKDTLSLFCECAFSTGIAFEGIERIVYGSTATQNGDEDAEIGRRPRIAEGQFAASVGLIDDLRSLYSSGEFCDIKIRIKQETIHAHKAILIARSPVFKAMFLKDMRERNEECVDISDIDSGILRQMILYMYTDTLEDLDWENALQLYEAADKYEILPLKNKCASYLKDNFCETKASGVLLLADMHHDTDLKNAAEEYILKHAQSIFLSEDWTDFCDANPKLAAETMRKNWKKDRVKMWMLLVAE